jgi:hypothetical protein
MDPRTGAQVYHQFSQTKLVGGAITILKNMSWSMGRIIPYGK